MKIEEYRAYLQAKDLPADKIDERLEMMKDFVDFLVAPDFEDIIANARKEGFI